MNLSETKVLARIAVLAALGRHTELRAMFKAHATLRIPATKITETLLQVHLFAGFPASIEGLRAFNDVQPGRARIRHRRNDRSMLNGKRRGINTCKRVYGSKYSDLLASMRGLHPDLCAWMIEDGYGKVLSRSGLPLKERELIAIATLAGLGWPRQLHSHVKGCINVGVPPGSVRAVLRSIRVYLPPRRYRRALLVTEHALQENSA